MSVMIFGTPEKNQTQQNKKLTNKRKDNSKNKKKDKQRILLLTALFSVIFITFIVCLFFKTSLHFVSCWVHFTHLTSFMKTATPQSPSTSRERAKSLPRTTTVIGIRVVFFYHSAPTQREDTRRKLRPHACPAPKAILTVRREPDVAHLFSLRVQWSVVGRSFRVVLLGLLLLLLLLLLVVLPSFSPFGCCCCLRPSLIVFCFLAHPPFGGAAFLHLVWVLLHPSMFELPLFDIK